MAFPNEPICPKHGEWQRECGCSDNQITVAAPSAHAAGDGQLDPLDMPMQVKAEAFDRLIHDLGEKLPLESRIKKLYGLPLAQALEGFVIVPRDEWEKHRHITEDQGSSPARKD